MYLKGRGRPSRFLNYMNDMTTSALSSGQRMSPADSSNSDSEQIIHTNERDSKRDLMISEINGSNLMTAGM